MKDYLGDSVYANYDGYYLMLTTENGLPTDPSNTIALDPNTIDAFIRYLNRVMGYNLQNVPKDER